MGSRPSIVAEFPGSVLPSAVLLAVAVLSCPAATAQQKSPTSHSFEQTAALAKQASEANDLREAIPLYRHALALRPQWAEGWWSLGTILYDRDNYLEAARAFRKVVALQPDHGSARAMLGLCEFELGQDSAALRDIHQGRQLGIHPDPQLRRVVLFHEGVLLLRKGNFENAQQVFDLVSRDGVEGNELLLYLGMSVLRILPANAPPEGSTAREIALRAGRAESFAASKHSDEARKEYGQLADESPQTANIHYAYGRFLLELREIDAAVAEFQREIQNNPGHVLARLEIAAVRYGLDSVDGVKYAEQAVKLDPQRPFGHYILGLLYLDTNNFADAISELESAKRSYPNVPEVYFALGNAYARSGRKAAATRARATFTRLKAQSKKEPADNFYGEQTSGLTHEKLGAEADAKPPE